MLVTSVDDTRKYIIMVVIAVGVSLVCLCLQNILGTISVGTAKPHGAVVPGIIAIWYPPKPTITSLELAASSIPEGWLICDGTKGTPDLRGRFVLMGQDSAYPVLATGGAATHTLTVAEMPAHGHEGAAPGAIGVSFGSNSLNSYPTPRGRSLDTGGNQPHNNMPPYYTLIYIMCT